MNPTKLVLGFVPVVLYGLVVRWAGPASVPAAAFAAFAVAAGLVIAARVRGESVKMLIAASAAVFGAYGVLGLAVPGSEHFLAGYGRSVVALLLAAVIFLTLPVLPFTEQLAREAVPAAVAASPSFRALNRRISAAWGVVVLGLGAGHAASAALGDDASRLGDLLLNWGLPAVLFYAAYRYTTRLTAHATPQPTHA